VTLPSGQVAVECGPVESLGLIVGRDHRPRVSGLGPCGQPQPRRSVHDNDEARMTIIATVRGIQIGP
jgi:hypothetical protein